MSRASAPIGIYDSGLGGLSVVRHLQRVLPHESFVYLADTARVPYGGRAEAEISHFSHQIMEFLFERGVKAILCACNTSSVVILPELKNYRGIQVLGLAQAGSRAPAGYQKVALLATEATVRSGLYSRLMGMRFPGLEIVELACPEFVPLVESGRWSGVEVESIVRQRLAPLREYQPEAVILGCSHYPYLSDVLQKVLGEDIPLLDPAEHLVAKLACRLQRENLQRPVQSEAQKQRFHFYTTGDPRRFQGLAEAYLEQKLTYLKSAELWSASFPPLILADI